MTGDRSRDRSGRERKSKSRSLTLRRFYGYLSTVILGEFFHDGQSHAAAFDFIARFQRLENLEYPIVEHFGDTGAVVRNFDLEGMGRVSNGECYGAVLSVVMFDRISDQIAKNRFQRYTRYPKRNVLANDLDLKRIRWGQQFDGFINDCSKVQFLGLVIESADPRKFQQVVQ